MVAVHTLHVLALLNTVSNCIVVDQSILVLDYIITIGIREKLFPVKCNLPVPGKSLE